MRFHQEHTNTYGLRFKVWRWVVEFRYVTKVLKPRIPDLEFVVLHRDESWMEGSRPWPRVFSISFDSIIRNVGVYVGERHVAVGLFDWGWKIHPHVSWWGKGRRGHTLSIGLVRKTWMDKSDTITDWGGPIRYHRWEDEPSPSCSPSPSPSAFPEP